MTWFITAHTKDKARLIVTETRTTDGDIAELVALHLRRSGLHVIVRKEA